MQSQSFSTACCWRFLLLVVSLVDKIPEEPLKGAAMWLRLHYWNLCRPVSSNSAPIVKSRSIDLML